MGRSLWRVLGKCLILIVLERLEQDVGPDGRRCSKFVRRSRSERDSYDRHIGAQWLSLAVFIREECEGWSLDLFAYWILDMFKLNKKNLCVPLGVLRIHSPITILFGIILSFMSLWLRPWRLSLTILSSLGLEPVSSRHLIIPGLGIMVGPRTLHRGDFDCTSAPTACNSPISPFPTKLVRATEPWSGALRNATAKCSRGQARGGDKRGSIWSRNWNQNSETIQWLIHLKGLKFHWIYNGNRRMRRKKVKHWGRTCEMDRTSWIQRRSLRDSVGVPWPWP